MVNQNVMPCFKANGFFYIVGVDTFVFIYFFHKFVFSVKGAPVHIGHASLLRKDLSHWCLF